MNNNVSKNILDHIKEEKIQPRPRWQFVLAKVALVLALVASIIVGGVVLSVIFLKLNNLDWEFVSLFGDKGLPMILEVLPVIWIVLLVLLLGLAAVVFEKTDNGYKYKPGWVVLVAIVLSTILAGLIYLSSLTELLEETMRANLPFYEEMELRRETKFNLPEIGILPGRIVSFPSKSVIELQDLRENVWKVELVPPLVKKIDSMKLKQGQMVFAVGKVTAKEHFLAKDLRLKRGVKVKKHLNVLRKGGGILQPPRPPAPLPPPR